MAKNKNIARDLFRLLNADKVLAEPEDRLCYAADATRYFAQRSPDAVVLPETTEDVSRVMKYAFARTIPVTPRGAGSGLSGGCTPIKGGIVLDMKRMNRIVEINLTNLVAQVEPGVVLAHFQRAVEKEKLFYPPDPQSMDVCTLGGNIATRAGGPRGVKYGATGNYVLGLEVVLPDGSVINTGGTCVKHSVGYDLTHLLTGSEGTLGVITRANLRLLPLPPARKTMVAVCETPEQAASLVTEIISQGAVPARLEFLLKSGIGLMNVYLANRLPMTGEAYLLMEIDGLPAQVREESGRIAAICAGMKVLETRVVEDDKEAESYWRARQNLNPILQAIFKRVISEDITVPRDKIPQLVQAMHEISVSLGIPLGLAGHAGDGNIHPTVLLAQVNEETEKKAAQAVERIIRTGLKLGGAISGEHGIGLHKSEFIELELGRTQIEVMKSIKKAIDPKGIMNPGKIWMEEAGL